MFKQMYAEKFMRFPEGKCKALTFSYDDGVEADKRLIEIFDRYNLKATFNLNNPFYGAGKHGTMDEEQAYSVYKDCGHEIALHGDRHVFLTRVPLTEAVCEISDNRRYLEDKYKRIVRGMAYAYGDYNDGVAEMLGKLGVTYARTTQSSHSFSLPENWLRLKPTCHHTECELFTLLDKFVSASPEQEFKKREAWLFYVWGHSFEFDDNNDWERIEEFAKRASGRKDVWYATNGQIREYVRAYENLVFSADGGIIYNPSHMPVWIETRGKIYKVNGGETVKC